MSFALFDLNNNSLEMTPAKIKSYLSAELGILSEQKRNTKILEIMEKPADAIADYNTAMNTYIGEGAVLFKSDYDKLMGLGVSDGEAQRIAKKKAQDYIKSKKYILDFEYPLMDDISTLASAGAGTSISVPTQQRFGRKGRK